MSLQLNDEFEADFKVSEVVFNGFIDLFKDQNPLHTNNEFAINHGFKSKVMHGNILNGFLSYFIGECLPMKNVIIHSQEIQFKKPVYLNDLLKLSAVVSGIVESVKVIEFKFSFMNDESVVVAKGKFQIGLIG